MEPGSGGDDVHGYVGAAGHDDGADPGDDGIRRSELLGLRWGSVDLEELEITIEAKLIVVKSRPVFSELTETAASRRTVALDPGSADELRRHRIRQTERRLEHAVVWHDEHGLVFTDEIGWPFHPNRLTRTLIASAAAGLPPIGVHGLRHSLATAALEMEVPAKVAAERLGHASVATTLDRYSHVSREQDRNAAVALAELMLG